MVFDGYMAQRLAQYDSDYDFKKNAFLDELACATLSGSLYPVGVSAVTLSVRIRSAS